MERTGERDIVDVVARGGGIRPCLAPAGHAPVDQLRIVAEQDVGTQAEAFGHPGAEPLNQAIGRPAQVAHDRHAVG